MFEAAIITVVGVFLIMCRFNLRRILGYRTVVDIVGTVFFVFMFQGTYAGMMTGLFAGVLLSLTLNVMKGMIGCERARLVRQTGNIFPSIVWERDYGRLS